LKTARTVVDASQIYL